MVDNTIVYIWIPHKSYWQDMPVKGKRLTDQDECSLNFNKLLKLLIIIQISSSSTQQTPLK